jgi:hypothetical protein
MTLRLGAIESVLHSWLIPMVEKLRNDHEGLELELTVEKPRRCCWIRSAAGRWIFAALPASMEGLRSNAQRGSQPHVAPKRCRERGLPVHRRTKKFARSRRKPTVKTSNFSLSSSIFSMTRGGRAGFRPLRKSQFHTRHRLVIQR